MPEMLRHLKAQRLYSDHDELLDDEGARSRAIAGDRKFCAAMSRALGLSPPPLSPYEYLHRLVRLAQRRDYQRGRR